MFIINMKSSTWFEVLTVFVLISSSFQLSDNGDPGIQKCSLSKFKNIKRCEDMYNDFKKVDISDQQVDSGTVCIVEIRGITQEFLCLLGNDWLGLSETTGDDEVYADENTFDLGVKKVRKKKGWWGGSPPPTPPPPPPPSPECGHPGNTTTSSVSVTSTSQNGEATYTCFYGYTHTAGDLVRTCQSNRQWSGAEPTCTYMNSCSSGPCYNGGQCTNIQESYTCTCPAIWRGTRCEQVAYVCARNPCVNHVSCIDGANMYTCVCKPGWSGQECQIPADCGHPGNVDFCDVTVPETTLGKTASYACHTDYNMTSGDSVRQCQTDSTWRGDPPTCIFANSCKSNPCNNGATCTNLLDDFSCTCTNGWSGKTCSNDIQPPLVTQCSNDLHINATAKTALVPWTKPLFTDPMGSDIVVTSNYLSPEYEFPWGDFTVQYVATKQINGLKTECVFNISIRPTPCDPLSIPQYGAYICNDWSTDYGQICFVACKSLYSISPQFTYGTWWICGTTGHWNAPVPDCREFSDVGDILSYHSNYTDYSFDSCNEGSDVVKMQQLYMKKMKNDPVISDFCRLYPEGCSSENVRVVCDL